MESAKNNFISSTTKKGSNCFLISTKLQIPQLKSNMLCRKHLIERLTARKDCRLTVISGKAGSGKTSLVCQWIRQENLPVVWYSLDETDNESDLFFRYLLIALSDMDLGLASIAKPILEDQERLSGSRIIPFLIRHLINLSKDIYLILDDYHVIHSKEIHDSLLNLLNHIPIRMHVVIISRYSIPFSLSRFKLRNQVIEISSADLRFTNKEMEHYFKQIIPVKLTGDQVQELAKYTEGWVGAIQLFGLSFKGKESPDSLGATLSRAFQVTTDYLIDEVINIQPPQIKTFLLETALLDRFNSNLCLEVSGLTNRLEVLDYIYRNDIFLIPLDNEGTWFRYHHLFSKAVRKFVRISSPRMFARVQRKAAIWFARNNYLEDAFRQAFASEDFEFVADLLEDHLVSLYERSEIAASLRWLEKVPYEVFMRRPILRFHECVLRMHSLQPSDIETAIEGIDGHQTQIFKKYRGRKKVFSQSLFILFKHILPYYRDPASIDMQQLNRLNEALRTVLPESVLLSVFTKVVIARYLIVRGDLPRANKVLGEVSTMLSSSGCVWLKIIWFRLMADLERLQGRLHRSKAIVMEAFHFLERKGSPDKTLKPILSLPMAWVHYYHNEIEKALENVSIALKYAEQFQMAQDILEARMLLALIYLVYGEKEKALQCAQEMQWASKEGGSQYRIDFADVFAVHISMSQGDPHLAEQWIEDQSKQHMDQEFSFLFVFGSLVHAKILHGKGRHKKASHILEKVRDRCVTQNMMQSMLDIDFLYSSVLYALKAHKKATEIMGQALTFAESRGFIRPSIINLPTFFPLLNEMVKNDPHSKKTIYLKNIIKISGIDLNDKTAPTRTGFVDIEYLTPREIEILGMLADGYKYKEIAERAFISLDTVRTHTRHIFEKLGVNTRYHATQRAEELKLLAIK